MAADGRDQSRSRKAGSRGVPRAVREPQILEVAGKVFAARGYHAASMEEIAVQADVTKPLVYAYFGSKENLYLAYVQYAGAELLDRLRGAAAPTASPSEQLYAGILAFLQFVDERRNGWVVLYSEVTARGGPLAEGVASLREAIAELIKIPLTQGAVGTELSAKEMVVLDGVAHAFVGAGESLANWWLAHPELPPERVADLLIAFGRVGVEQAVIASPR